MRLMTDGARCFPCVRQGAPTTPLHTGQAPPMMAYRQHGVPVVAQAQHGAIPLFSVQPHGTPPPMFPQNHGPAFAPHTQPQLGVPLNPAQMQQMRMATVSISKGGSEDRYMVLRAMRGGGRISDGICLLRHVQGAIPRQIPGTGQQFVSAAEHGQDLHNLWSDMNAQKNAIQSELESVAEQLAATRDEMALMQKVRHLPRYM
jgi:hypothetical protein